MITDYASLKTEIAAWLDRTDLVDKIPTFIQLAENNLFRKLRCPGNEQLALYSASNFDNTKYIDIPNDYKACKLLTYGNKPLIRISDQFVVEQKYTQAQGGRASLKPSEFGRLKNQLWFFPSADQNEDVNLWYWEFQGPLVNDTDTTRTLQFAPALYLYGALVEAQGYLIGDDRIATWKGLFNEVYLDVSDESAENEMDGSTTAVRNSYV